MEELNQIPDEGTVKKARSFINLLETKLPYIVIIALTWTNIKQAQWNKEMALQIVEIQNARHQEDKEYMLFFRDQYNQTSEYLKYVFNGNFPPNNNRSELPSTSKPVSN